MNSCLFRFGLFFVWMGMYVAASGQAKSFASIQGIVTDKVSGEKLAGVQVILDENVKGTQTDTLGFFQFTSLHAGTYSLEFRLVGYIPFRLPLLGLPQGKQLVLSIELESDLNPLKEAEVKAFRFENSRLKSLSVFSFSREEISLNPGAQGDIFRAIGMLPGVTSSGGVYSAISVRGQGVRDNVYLVDDIPLTEVGHLEGNSFFNDPNGGRFSIFAPRVIDHALFQAGGFGAEYGRRSASALELTIKEGNRGSSIVDGQVDLLGLTLNYDGILPGSKKTSLFASARYQNFYPLVKLVGLESLGLPTYSDFILKSSTPLNSRNKLNALLMVCPESFVRTMENLYADKELNLLYLPDFRRNKIIAGLNLQTRLAGGGLLKTITYYTGYFSEVKVGKAYPQAEASGNIQPAPFFHIPVIQTQSYSENKWGFRTLYENSFGTGKRLLLGIEGDILQLTNQRALLVNDTLFVFRRNQLLNPLLNYQVITPELVNANFANYALNASFFGAYFLSLGTKWSLQPGLRMDYTGFSKAWMLAPRLQLSYQVHSNHSLSLGIGHYYQDPVYSEVADLPPSNRLKPEKISQAVVGYRGYFKNNLKLMVEFWWKEFSQLIVSPLAGAVQKNNKGFGSGKGLDISLTKRLSGNWHGMLSYSYMDARRNDGDGSETYAFTFSQPHQLNLMLSYELNAHFSFSGKFRSASGQPTDAGRVIGNVLNNPSSPLYSFELLGRNKSRLPDFSSLDLRVNYRFSYKRIRFISFVDIVNVLNKQIPNAQNFNALKGKTYYDGLAIFPSGGLKFEF